MVRDRNSNHTVAFDAARGWARPATHEALTAVACGVLTFMACTAREHDSRTFRDQPGVLPAGAGRTQTLSRTNTRQHISKVRSGLSLLIGMSPEPSRISPGCSPPGQGAPRHCPRHTHSNIFENIGSCRAIEEAARGAARRGWAHPDTATKTHSQQPMFAHSLLQPGVQPAEAGRTQTLQTKTHKPAR